jgi:hypothetical protein
MTDLMVSDFITLGWSAWDPGIYTKNSEKNNYPEQLIPEVRIEVPDWIPKALKRRLSPLAKAVITVADKCLKESEPLPAVFSSTHGEVNKSLAMLNAIQAGVEISPTAFSLSVHNAIAGLFSMGYANRLEISVIAPGQEGIASAFIEALGLLHEGVKEVLLVLYDEPIVDFYPLSPFKLNAPTACVLALKIALAGEGQPLRFWRMPQTQDDGEQPLQLQAFLRFLLSEDTSLTLGNHRHSWKWDKT